MWTVRFILHMIHTKILGAGRWVWVDEKGVHADKPLWVGASRRARPPWG